jgi:hypothetical protein
VVCAGGGGGGGITAGGCFLWQPEIVANGATSAASIIKQVNARRII